MVPITFVRLNSHRLPNKSILPLSGIPLYEYSMKTIQSIDSLRDPLVYASDDYFRNSKNIHYNFVKRPKHLDGDVDFNDLMTSSLEHINSEFILFFCVTSPFLKKETIEDMIDAVKNRGYDSAFPAIPVKNFCWFKNDVLNYDLSKRIPWTQDLEPVFVESSGLYIFKKELFEKTGRRIGYKPYIKEVDPIEGHDIDYRHDFELARSFIERGLV